MTGIVRIPIQSGRLFEVPRGAIMRITDPCGQQVSDVFAVAAADTRESLSSGRTLDNVGRYLLSTGDVLYSNRSNPMFRIGEDTVGRHDFLLTPCSQETFDLLYPDHVGYHPSCLENLSKAFAPYGVAADQIGTTFNAFMNVIPTPAGGIEIRPGLSRAGDHLDLIAEVDLLVGVTSCSAEMCNNGTLAPIDVELFEVEAR
jgi:uncharacterized protein YcgI (DUF1989 family)